MKLPDIVQKSDKELEQIVEQTRQEIADSRLELRTKELPNVKRILSLRKQLARALTISRERQIAASETAETEAANG